MLEQRGVETDVCCKIEVEKVYTARLEDTVKAIRSNDHTNAVVVISVLTNNAKANQNILRAKDLMQEALEQLKKQITPENIIVIESPPALRFNIFLTTQPCFMYAVHTAFFFLQIF